MNSRDRIITALNHKEADRVPFDLSGSHVTGIHAKAYINLCNYLGIAPEPLVFSDIYQQTVIPCQKLLERFEIDTRGLFPLCSHNWNVKGKDFGAYLEHIDEWGFVQHFRKDPGNYWSLVRSPIDGMIPGSNNINAYKWPYADSLERVAGLRALAKKYRNQGKIVMIKSICAGLFEMGQRIRGMENFLCDLIANKQLADFIMDNVLVIKKKYWKMVIDELGDVIDVVVESDDYGTQESQLLSEETFHTMITPRLRELVTYTKSLLSKKKKAGEKGYFFLHSCGNVRPLLPAFIDIGIDIINPVHISAKEMEPEKLKIDFGDKITFWGGGVDTQNVLPYGTPKQICEDVKNNVTALKQGGGFVFNTVHNIQADVPPENIMAMHEAFQKYGEY